MNEKFSQYLIDITYYHHANHEWRYGQTAYNVLEAFDCDLADKVRGTNLDPFHDDDRLPEFLATVRDKWSE